MVPLDDNDNNDIDNNDNINYNDDNNHTSTSYQKAIIDSRYLTLQIQQVLSPQAH